MTSDDLPECPLCMVELFYDDLGFYPCSCGYQICRFCWSRILNEENGLCPACRGPYDSEAPASFTPLSEEQFQKLKKEKRNKERRNKTVENRKHLADIRVVQKNLAFVIGLPQRFADTQEILKGPEYFGKYGKVFKVVVNRNAAQPGSQGQGTAGAYVTFVRHEDAVRAILDLNKQQMEGRTLKASLGTTKYCSQFLKGATCTKHECMYLHELGEEAASFTKEEMQQNKHTEYERKLIDEFIEANASIERSLLLSSASQAQSQAQPAANNSSDSNHHPRQLHTSECRDHSSSSSNSNTPPASRRATKSESQKSCNHQRNQHHRAAQNSNSQQSSSGDNPSQRTPRKTSQSHKQSGNHQSGSQSRQSPPQNHHQRNRQNHHQHHQQHQQSHQQHNQQQPTRKVSSHSADEAAHTRQPPPSEDDRQSSQQVQSSQPPQPPPLPVSQTCQPQDQELQQSQADLQQQQLQLQHQQLQLLQQQYQQKQQHLQQTPEGSTTDLRHTSLPPGLSQKNLLPGGCGPLGDAEQLVSGTTSSNGSVSSSSASLNHLLTSSLSLANSSSVLNGLNCNYSLPPMYSLQFLQDRQHHHQSELSSSFEAHRLARSASLTEKSSADADASSLHAEHQYPSLNRVSRWPVAASSSTHDSPAEVMFCPKDDDAGLDFDPVKESQQGLAALIEDERGHPHPHQPQTSAASFGGPSGMAPPPGFEVPAYAAPPPMRGPMSGFSFFHGGLAQHRLPGGMDMGLHNSDSDLNRHMGLHSQQRLGGLPNHLGATSQHQAFGPSVAAVAAAAAASANSTSELPFSVKALQDTLRCILPEETTITFDPSFMRDSQPQTTDHEGFPASSTSTKESTSVWPRNGFRLDDDPAILASGHDAVHPIHSEFNPFWPTSSNSKPGRLENDVSLRSEMVWSSPTTPPGFGSSVLSLLGGLGNGSTAVDVDRQRAVNVDRHTSVTATGDQQITNQL